MNIDESLEGQAARCTCGSVVKMLLADPSRDRPELLPTVRPPGHRKRLDLIPEPIRDLDQPLEADQPSEPPLIGDAFSDLDDILDGAPDSRPLAAQAAPQQPPPTRQPVAKPEPERNTSTGWGEPIGVVPTLAMGGTGLASISGIALGCWVLAARLSGVEVAGQTSLLGPLQTWFQAGLGDPLSGTQKTLLVVTGWLATLVAAAMLLIGGALLIRAAVQFFTNHRVLGWCRGLAAGLAVAGLLTILGGIFLEEAHFRARMQTLEAFQQPIEGLVEDLGNVKQLRQEYTDEHTGYRTTLLVLGSLPTIVFFGTMFSLFIEGRDRQRGGVSQNESPRPNG